MAESCARGALAKSTQGANIRQMKQHFDSFEWRNG